ncbi:MAG TPA: hypothetical protein DCP08_06880 [Chloroflexi bacterium]|nr:hypothetical protein [Chloroflexota bacterium]
MGGLKIFEIKNGRLPEGVTGKDITGPIVLMKDGELPPGVTEADLEIIGATVLSLEGDESPPIFIGESDRLRLIEPGLFSSEITDAFLLEKGIVVVDDSVLERSTEHVEREIREAAKELTGKDIKEQLSWVTRRIGQLEQILLHFRRMRDELERLLEERQE